MIMKRTLLLISGLALAWNASADSLWKDDVSRGATADKKARFVGDILNVRVQESNVAKRNAKTETSRATAADASISSFLFGTQAGTSTGSQLGKHKGTYPAMKFANTTTHAGTGKIDNSDSIVARFSVRVVDVLPNGNLIVEGTRQSSYAGETQTVVLRGAVRPFDIEQDNTIYSYLLSDLNIRYLSNGVISKAKDKGWFMNFWDTISPF
jgi:flagellar L-ring protein precursor FlgH